MSDKDFIMTLAQDKVCKNSVRYSASSDQLQMLGVTKQPFSIYVPNDLLPDPAPKEFQITVDFS